VVRDTPHARARSGQSAYSAMVARLPQADSTIVVGNLAKDQRIDME
jgi:hypothetical protein